MELAWNTQKNKLSDVKGKEMEQERKGKIKNKDIDLSKTERNIDLVQSEKNLYQRVKERIDDLKKSGSRVQKNSVVMYSNILTVSEEQAKTWGEEKTEQYFKTCHQFFCNEFGKENVVSAKIHKDETSPHMHLHFIPVNKENGKLQARVSMNKEKINYIHDELPLFLQKHGFDVFRATGKTKDNNIEDVHEYKEIKKQVEDLERVKSATQMNIEQMTLTRTKLAVESDELKKSIEANKLTIERQNKQMSAFVKNKEHVEEVSKLTKRIVVKKTLTGKETGECVIPKSDLMQLVKQAKMSSQHKARADAAWSEYSNLNRHKEISDKAYDDLKHRHEWLLEEKEQLLKENKELASEKNGYLKFLHEKNMLEPFQNWLRERKKKEKEDRLKQQKEKEIKKQKNRGMER